MKLEIDDATINTVIHILQSAMRKAQVNMIVKNTKTNMSVPFDKWDCIGTRIYDVMDNDKYRLGILDLRIFQIALIYELKSKILFSIMRKSNYDEVLDRQKKATHYSNATLSFNRHLPRLREQLTLEGCEYTLSEKEKDTLAWKKDMILEELRIEESEISSYVTISFEEQGFALTSVQGFLTNTYYEIIDSKDWSELIKPNMDYDILLERVKENETVMPIIEDETPIITENADVEIDISIKKKKESN